MSDNWPTCARCLCPVHAYGVENETKRTIDVWAECRGNRISGATGLEVGRHPPMREHATLVKGEGWTLENLRGALALLVFFA